VTTFGTIARHGGGWLPLLGIGSLAGTLTTLAMPFVLGRAVDGIVAGTGSGRWLAAAGGLVALGVLADIVSAFAGTACVAGTTAWLRGRLVRHVLAIGPEGARRFDTGDLVSRVSSNAADAAGAGPSLVSAGMAALPPVGSLIMLGYIDFRVAAAFLAGVALVAVALRAFARRTTAIVTSYQRIQGMIAARLTESLAGARTIAAAGTVEREEARVLERLPELHEQGSRTWALLARTSAQAAVIGPLVLVAVLITGGFALLNGRISAGDLLAASRYAVIGAGLGGLTSLFAGLSRARAAAGRADEVLGMPPVPYGTRSLPPGRGELSFRRVVVRGADAALLDGVTLTVPGGSAVAVVGRSGAGKSVLAALAARLRDPDGGQVLLDGVPLAELRHDELRRAVGCAFEKPVLVGETVAESIRPDVDPLALRGSAHAVHAHEFVSRLPEGYRTVLADAPMSGGERQRLGLARAWHAERVLVLDDATSSLDMVTEMQIGQALTGTDGRTRLIVTHRVSTAARADLVVWLDRGRVRAAGPHARLWESPEYRGVFGS
jgi:ATP-binding cassette, subfamily B, bacterial